MTYISEVLADSPTHFWRCADPGGALLFDIGSAPRALSEGVVGFVCTPYAGPNSNGGAAYFDLNTNASYADSDLNVTTPLTLECWFWLEKSANALQDFLGISNGATALAIGVDATLHAHAFSSGGAIAAAAVTTRQAWHHLVLTQTAALGTLYLDAVSVGTLAGAAVNINPNFLIGSGGSAGSPVRFAHAAVSECAIYASALSAARVTAHFTAADNTTGSPVWGGGGLAGVGGSSGATNPLYLGILQQILQSVRKVY